MDNQTYNLAQKRGKAVSINMFDQEINPETYAITCADMIIKGEGGSAENFIYGTYFVVLDSWGRSPFVPFHLFHDPIAAFGRADALDMSRLLQ